ncbi:MAG: DUF3499 domain-containing protein [Propionibacteriaceae bacterium]|nr:DUF3499 domain-containing protein [Propionibacteriaceae bacterium]
MTIRSCRRQGCSARAKATLTFDYADSTAVLGPLAPDRVSAGLDLCPVHCESVTVPRGWQLVRLPLDEPGPPVPGQDLRELADAIRAAAGLAPTAPAAPAPPPELPSTIVTLAERRHLRVVADAERQRGQSRVS